MSIMIFWSFSSLCLFSIGLLLKLVILNNTEFTVKFTHFNIAKI